MLDFSNKKVLVFGDICLDVIVEGKSHRMSPEAPVPVVLNPKTSYTLGMAGNVALNLKHLGADVNLCTAVFQDSNGRIISDLVKENDLCKKISTHLLSPESDGACSTVKKRIFSNNQQIGRIDYEMPIAEKDIIDTYEKGLVYYIRNGIKFDAIVISDYNKGTITKNTWPIFIEYFKEMLKEDGQFFVDTKKKDILSYYEGMNIFPNTKEMQEIMDYNNCKTRNELRKEMDLDFIIETAGENGAYIFKEGKTLISHAYKKGVIDVCGCGDTFVASFILYYLSTGKKLKSLDFANYCSSIVGQKRGTSTVSKEEIQDYTGW